MNIQEKLAYAAGIIDGEGTIATYRVKNGRGEWGMRPQLIVSQKELPLLEWLKEQWGGRIYTEKPRLKFGKQYEPCSYWHLQHSKAIELVRQLIPFLIVKKQRAIEFVQPSET